MGEDEGRESEWNEGDFKNRRLNEIQEWINFLKVNLLGRTGNKFNYELLLTYIESMYAEGHPKYSPSEKEEVDKLKEECNKILRTMPPHIQSKRTTISGDTKSFLFNQKNFDELVDSLWKFELLVRDLNDKHGLGTKNRKSRGLF